MMAKIQEDAGLHRLVPLDRLGWPVEFVRGRPMLNMLRFVIHARAVITRTEWRRRWQEWESRRPSPPGIGTGALTFPPRNAKSAQD